MNKGSYVFSQLVKFLDEFVFLRIVKKYDGDKYVKLFSCWNQLCALMLGQLTGKESLRRFIVASAPFKHKFYALGLGKNVTRSNLSNEVANLYKNRWQIELFFKWMKQHLNIQKFWGETENAVRIQIYSAITAYCMVAIAQHDTGTEMSIFEVLETVSLVLTEKIHLRDLLCKSNDNIVNELDQFSELTLF